MKKVMVLHDAVIVGGGPAGLSAATWLGRYRRKTVVVDSGEYRNRWVEQVHGFLGNDPTKPAELLDRARRDLAQYPHVEVREGCVDRVVRSGRDDLSIRVGEERIEAKRLVLATGVRDDFPDVERLFEHYGRDVFHCPTCDGFDARDQCVAVFGWERHVAGFAIELLDWAAEVRIITNGRAMELDAAERQSLARRGIEVIEDVAVGLLGARGELQGIRLASGERTRCTMAFFSIRHRPRTELAHQLGCEIDEDGYVVVDHEQQTTVPGVYAAGDVTAGMQLVAVGVAKGTVAGVACAESLRRELDPEAVLAGEVSAG